MASSKAEVLRAGNVSNQQALVQRLMNRTIKPKKRVIPGGANMLETLDQTTLTRAVYNWLRGCRDFETVQVSLAKDPNKFAIEERKIVDFPADGPHEVWVTHDDGKMYLARLIAGVLSAEKVVYVRAKKDGLYTGKDTNNAFGPTREATEQDIEAADPDSTLSVGDTVPSEDWEP